MKYDTDLIKKIRMFEDTTGASVKDAMYYKDMLTFIVEPGEMGKALGKNKQHIRRLQEQLEDDVKVAEYREDVLDFITNFLKPLDIAGIERDGDVIHIYGGDERTTGIIIGSGGSNLRELEDVVQRYFDIDEIKCEQNG